MIKQLRLLSSFSLLAILSSNASAQMGMFSSPPKNWQNESIETDSIYGTGSDKALELLKGRTPTQVIVSVNDGGVYINHPALKGQIWVNSKEIPGNKIDDDKNGYVDDVNGWDFIGGKDSSVKQENVEVTRIYRDLGKKYANTTADKVAKKDKEEYAMYIKAKAVYEDEKGGYKKQYDNIKGFIDTVSIMKGLLGKSDFTPDDLNAYIPKDSNIAASRRREQRNFGRFAGMFPGGVITADSLVKQFNKILSFYNAFLTYQYNVDFNPRYVVGDNYADMDQRNYGNNDVVGPTDVHGTHVSGIIAGIRTGKPGSQEGIADDAKIMVVRCVPDGDERDKDVANGIRYAVDNGARVINMSFGKPFSPNKKAVDEAVKYAEKHDVLLVHAAGNDHKNTDSAGNFPNQRFEGTTKTASNWIEVGASDMNGKPGSFSNYGKKNVDLFAPGVKVYSSIPDTNYGYFNGTSMASPCVAGVAAIIREYFPKLKASQVKKILMESVTPITFKVPEPGHPDVMVSYSDLCVSGGIVNAYKAVQLAIKESK
jgi:cell wall-associated protease